MLRLTFILLLLVSSPAWSQTKITWETLKDVRFIDKFSQEEQAYYYYPYFGRKVKELEGKQVFLRGYILVLDAMEGFYILSLNPYAACFFCGNAGPESIVELKLKPGQPRFRMDQVVTIKGTLRLNQDNLDECNYIFDDAELFHP